MIPATHAQVKQWSVYFTEPNLNAGQHSGKAREYNFDEAFKILFGGSLIRSVNYKITESQKILSEVFSWLESKSWTPLQSANVWKSAGKLTRARPLWHFTNNFPNLILFIAGANDRFGYQMKEIFPLCESELEDLSVDDPEDEGITKFMEKGLIYYFGEQGEFLKYESRMLDLQDILKRLGIGWCRVANDAILKEDNSGTQ